MVLYFSGTGNSQFAALQIAKLTDDDEIISINKYLKSGKKTTIRSGNPLVFVAPTYSWRMPRVVEQWILDTGFKGCKDAYFILTCGVDAETLRYMLKNCARKKACGFVGFHRLLCRKTIWPCFQRQVKQSAKRSLKMPCPSSPRLRGK